MAVLCDLVIVHSCCVIVPHGVAQRGYLEDTTSGRWGRDVELFVTMTSGHGVFVQRSIAHAPMKILFVKITQKAG